MLFCHFYFVVPSDTFGYFWLSSALHWIDIRQWMNQDIYLISYCVSDISCTAPVRTHSNLSVIMSEFVSVSDSVWLSPCVWLCLTWVLLLHKCAHIQIWGINHPQEKPFPWFGLSTLQENLRNKSVTAMMRRWKGNNLQKTKRLQKDPTGGQREHAPPPLI